MNTPLQGRDLRNYQFFPKFNLKTTEHLNVSNGEIRMHDNEEDGPICDLWA